jgi:DNA-binding MarR family transcriptional regulator
MSDDPVRRLLEFYPKIFLACHTRHVRDPQTNEVLTSHQASILDHLDEADPLNLADLARHMGVTPGTMSVAIDRLVQLGCVVRERDSEDGRRLQLRLTARGAQIKSAQTVLDPELVRALLEMLTPEEQADGLRGLAILARAAQAVQKKRSEQGTWSRRSRPKSDSG